MNYTPPPSSQNIFPYLSSNQTWIWKTKSKINFEMPHVFIEREKVFTIFFSREVCSRTNKKWIHLRQSTVWSKYVKHKQIRYKYTPTIQKSSNLSANRSNCLRRKTTINPPPENEKKKVFLKSTNWNIYLTVQYLIFFQQEWNFQVGSIKQCHQCKWQASFLLHIF